MVYRVTKTNWSSAVEPLIAIAGLGAIGYGRQCGKGVKTRCTQCGKTTAARSDTKAAENIRKRFGKDKPQAG